MEEEAPFMSGKFLSLKMTFVIGVMLFATGKPLSAQQERTIHSFGKHADDRDNGGTVFQLRTK
jgi:hypothetical protein